MLSLLRGFHAFYFEVLNWQVFLIEQCESLMRKTNICLVINMFLCILLLVLSGIVTTAFAESQGKCNGCHSGIVSKGKNNRILHSPFLKGDCAVCHIVGQQSSSIKKKSSRIKAKEQLEKIRWFRDAHGISAEHWILLPEDKVTGVLFYKAWDGRMRSPLQSMELPDLASFATKKNDLQSPQIESVRVADVRRGISTSVTIRWETDEFADSEVLYGKDQLLSAKFDGKLSRSHQLVLVGLDADETYRFQVISRDLFGNRVETKVFSFTTDRTFIEPDSRRDGSRLSRRDISIERQIFRHQNDYLLIFSADRPVSLSLGVQNIPKQEQPIKVGDKNTASSSGHPMLKSRLDTNIKVCYSCHPSFNDSYTHPINVFPRAGMVIPSEYPLLPDGRISCMSCHSRHGANYEYRLIKSHKKELCRGCHRDY